jgi:uncharacterized protein
LSWQHVHLGDVPPSPWRNGGGVTRELLAWPDSQDWLWRLSVAEVARAGPFSRFVGVQRWFAVLGEGGVRLSLGGQTHVLTRRNAPLCFDGDVPIDCDLLDSATQDFNLMVRSPQVVAQMSRVSGTVCVALSDPKIIAVYAIDSRAEVQFDGQFLMLAGDTLVWQSLPVGATLQISGPDFLWMEIALRT